MIRHAGRSLVTARYADLRPPAQSPFREVYRVSGAADYFGLVWHPDDEPLPVGTRHVSWDEVPPALAVLPPDRLPVFCPVSGRTFPEPIAGLVEARPMTCLDRSWIGLGDGPPARAPELMGMRVALAVVLVTGEWTTDLATDAARADLLAAILEHQFGRPQLEAAVRVGLPAALLRVDHVTDEDGPLADLLAATLFGDGPAPLHFLLTGPIRRLRPPLGQAMCCLVGPSEDGPGEA